MSDYISREQLKKRFCTHCESYDVSTGCTEKECFDLQIIDSIPAADVVEREQSDWEWHPYSADWACVCCDYHSMEHTNFCPNYGADMRGDS